ncbi:MAG TPA: aromatic ring-hydroxylating dioxygenase subunit alpha [Chloroflexota bacterium]|nr:aromatic ring-hydroxylating dioxygenase subunit alpha [Chloroflexota bacterium]
MLTAEENEILTRVGPGTPAGELLRRYWHPFCVAKELTENKPIKRVRILGEDLVVFRDRRGRFGLVTEHCTHRGASLAYGFVEEDGIRCAYHGWKFDVLGKCLEQPFEPVGSTYKERVCQRAYPVQKLAGLLWTYMGPMPAPLLPRWDVLVRQDGERQLEIRPLDCNWLQAMENTADVTHTYFLHGHTLHLRGVDNPGVRYYYRPFKKYGFKRFEWGLFKYWTYGGEHPESAMGHPLVFPNILRLWEHGALSMHWRVPVDDTHTLIFRVYFRPSPGGTKLEQTDDPPVKYFPSSKTAEGEYTMDSFAAQDQMAWETQGPIYDRTTEHLGASDRGIVMYRQMLREQIEIVKRGGEPTIGIVRDPSKNQMIEIIVHEDGEPEEDENSYSVIPVMSLKIS